MRDRELFTAALGLGEPWRVTSIEFSVEEQRLDLHLDFTRGARFPCPEGDETACRVHDTTDKTWRHMDFFEHRAYLHARVPRVTCPSHGVRQVVVPWARPESGFTLMFEALLMTLMSQMPVKAVADLVGEHDTRLWRLMEHHVGKAREEFSYAGVSAVGVDETSARRGHDYITLFCDLSERRVVFATEGKDANTVKEFAKDLLAHGADPCQITETCLDMSPAFISGIGDYLQESEMTFDRYHLAQGLSKAIDEVRRQEAKRKPILKKTRYLWLKNPAKLTDKQKAHLAHLRARDRALQTARAYRWRLEFDEFFNQPAHEAEGYLDRWYRGAIRSRLDPIKNFAYTVGEHWRGVLRWHTTKINTGILEAINSLVQAAKRRARGYRTKKNLIAMTYLIAGKLDLQFAHTK